MRDNLVFALDRSGCLQTARWSDVSPQCWRRRSQIPTNRLSPVPDKPAEIRNDFGLQEVRVWKDSVVCTGESPPEDHPHVTLRIGRNGSVTCPYCGTVYRSSMLSEPAPNRERLR